MPNKRMLIEAAEKFITKVETGMARSIDTYSDMKKALEAEEDDLIHGVNCEKVTHIGDGYLHSLDDDTTYYIDGIECCGRCHHAM